MVKQRDLGRVTNRRFNREGGRT